MGASDAFCHSWQLYIAIFWLQCSCIQRKMLSLKDWFVVVLSPCSFLLLAYTLARLCMTYLMEFFFEDPPQKLSRSKIYKNFHDCSVNSEVAHSVILRPLLKILSQFTSTSNKWHLWNFWDHLKNSVPVANQIFVIFEIHPRLISVEFWSSVLTC